jgi:hypothetical protein
MNKNSIPSEKAIQKGIIGKSMAGVNYKAIVSRIGEQYYNAFEVQREMESAEPGELLKPGQLLAIRQAKNFIEALRDAINYG